MRKKQVGNAAAAGSLRKHGLHGVSTDTLTPTLAGQDFTYLVEAIKAYRTTRKRENMRLYITGLSDKEIENIAAFYTVQKSKAVEKGQTIIQELSFKTFLLI